MTTERVEIVALLPGRTAKQQPRTEFVDEPTAARTPVDPPARHAVLPAGTVAPSPGSPRTPPSGKEAATPSIDDRSETRFYRSAEVDRRTEPQSDWNLDTSMLDAVHIGRLVFDVYVDREGRIVACDVIEPIEMAEDVRKRLVERISDTVMEPAQRRGVPVANVRRMEAVVSSSAP